MIRATYWNLGLDDRYKSALRDMKDNLCSELVVPEGQAVDAYLATWKTPRTFRTNNDKRAIIASFETMLRSMNFRALHEIMTRQTSAASPNASAWRTVFARAILGYLKELDVPQSVTGASDAATIKADAAQVKVSTDISKKGNEYVAADAEGAARQLASMHRERQAAYAAKNRQKAKTIRRPDARAAADAYMAAIEDTRLIELIVQVDENIARVHPDTTLAELPQSVKEERARAVIDYIRIFAGRHLEAKGFDREQIKDKLTSMIPK